ncbi:MAG TPA: LLM class flavin-dependent oxidoreductase [Candidatus Binataceae bacterium]|nr:LLM class flavin-dependent oxidoreductase [Candidatus Binataceae bacterium]
MLNVGLLFAFRNPTQWRIPFTDLYEGHLRQCVKAEELGYDTIWLTEHHFLEDGYSPSLLPIAAAIGARTERVRIGTFVVLLPLHHPLRIAEDAATVDIISKGRFDLGLGQGYRSEEFEGFDIPRKERGARLEEGTEIIRRAWTETGFSVDGRFTKLHNIDLQPRPVQKPHPPLWLAARGPKSIGRVARLGYHFMGTGGVDQQQMYDDALRAAGKRIEDHKIAQLLMVYVAPDRNKAYDIAEKHVHYTLASYGKWMGQEQDLPSDAALKNIPPVEKLREPDTARFFGESIVIGTPDDAIRMIDSYLDRTRVTHLVLMMQLPGLSIADGTRSMELFAKEVLPHLHRKN